MNLKRILAIGVVAIGLAGSGLAFSQALSNPASSVQLPVDHRTPDAIDSAAIPASPDRVASSSTPRLDAAVAQAADKAALVMMCERGQLDPSAESRYLATAAAHPDLAGDIGPDCRLATFAP